MLNQCCNEHLKLEKSTKQGLTVRSNIHCICETHGLSSWMKAKEFQMVLNKEADGTHSRSPLNVHKVTFMINCYSYIRGNVSFNFCVVLHIFVYITWKII